MKSMQTGGQTVDGILIRTIDDGLLGGSPKKGEPLLGVLPHDYLSKFLVTIDFGKRKLRLDRGKLETNVGVTRYLTSGLGLEETMNAPVHVTNVLAGSSAAEQGIGRVRPV